MSQMERTRKGGLKRAGDYVEVSLNPDDNYHKCVCKAIHALRWEFEMEDSCPCLCHTSGCHMLDQPNDAGVQKPWTISSYLNSLFSKNSHFKFAVALFEVLISQF